MLNKNLKNDLISFLYIFIPTMIVGCIIAYLDIDFIKNKSESSRYIITLTIGCISYSIAFVWNIYSRILDLQSTDFVKNLNNSLLIEKINRIISKYRFHSYKTDYNLWIRIPYFVFLILGLIILPLLYSQYSFHILYGVNFSIIFLYYIFKLPDIYLHLRDKNEINILDLMKNGQLDTNDKRELFSLILQHNDNDIQELLNCTPNDVFDYILSEIEGAI